MTNTYHAAHFDPTVDEIDQTRDKPRPSQLAAQQLGAKGA